MDDVRDWEKRHGRVPEGAFVALRTDWSKRWPDAKAMRNADPQGVAHYPGWSLPVLKYLYEERKITASGHETTDTDPGSATSRDDYSLETYILGTDHYQIELLANLDQVPESGALTVVDVPEAEGRIGISGQGIRHPAVRYRQGLTEDGRPKTDDGGSEPELRIPSAETILTLT